MPWAWVPMQGRSRGVAAASVSRTLESTTRPRPSWSEPSEVAPVIRVRRGVVGRDRFPLCALVSGKAQQAVDGFCRRGRPPIQHPRGVPTQCGGRLSELGKLEAVATLQRPELRCLKICKRRCSWPKFCRLPLMLTPIEIRNLHESVLALEPETCPAGWVSVLDLQAALVAARDRIASLRASPQRRDLRLLHARRMAFGSAQRGGGLCRWFQNRIGWRST